MLSLADIADLFARRGHEQYAGEPVTQLEHALQTAHLAQQAGADDELVTACLLHDLGHLLQDLEDKKIRKNRSFSDAGMAELCHLHERLLSNLRLGMSVFLDGHVRDAQKLLEEKARFRDLEHEYAANHIGRLQDNTAQSIETSSLHLDLISELKRINSHICSIAYPILESAGALAATRIRPSHLGALDEAPR